MKAVRPEIKKPDIWFAVQHAHAKAAVILAHPDSGGSREAFTRAVKSYDDFLTRWQYHLNHDTCARPECGKPFERPHRRAGRVQRFCSQVCANRAGMKRRYWDRKLRLVKSA